jgi:hypothetical protein
MAFKKMYHGMMLVVGDGKRIVIKHDGTINDQDLAKLTMDELYFVMKRYCSGRVREDMIALIMRETDAPREAAGFWATLTQEQQEKALAYRDSENFGEGS